MNLYQTERCASREGSQGELPRRSAPKHPQDMVFGCKGAKGISPVGARDATEEPRPAGRSVPRVTLTGRAANMQGSNPPFPMEGPLDGVPRRPQMPPHPLPGPTAQASLLVAAFHLRHLPLLNLPGQQSWAVFIAPLLRWLPDLVPSLLQPPSQHSRPGAGGTMAGPELLHGLSAPSPWG